MNRKTQQALQKANRIMPAPQRLAELIELVNLLPVDATGLREMFDNVRSQYPGDSSDVEALFLDQFETLINTLPNKVKQFIGAPRNPDYPAYINQTAARRYNILVESLDLLTLIASGNNTAINELRVYYSKPINEKNMEEIWASRNLLDLVLSVRATPMELIRNEQGELEWRPNILFEAMQQAKHLRIRQCIICGEFYWAGRIDQPACSKRCIQTLRVRRWRHKYYTKYKQQRMQQVGGRERDQKESKKGRK